MEGGTDVEDMAGRFVTPSGMCVGVYLFVCSCLSGVLRFRGLAWPNKQTSREGRGARVLDSN